MCSPVQACGRAPRTILALTLLLTMLPAVSGCELNVQAGEDLLKNDVVYWLVLLGAGLLLYRVSGLIGSRRRGLSWSVSILYALGTAWLAFGKRGPEGRDWTEALWIGGVWVGAGVAGALLHLCARATSGGRTQADRRPVAPPAEQAWEPEAAIEGSGTDLTHCDLPNRDDLKRLALRAVLAYAARCARRAQPRPSSFRGDHAKIVEQAILTAERFALGDPRDAERAKSLSGEARTMVESLEDARESTLRVTAARAASSAASAAAACLVILPLLEDAEKAGLGEYTGPAKTAIRGDLSEMVTEMVWDAAVYARTAAIAKVSRSEDLDDPAASAAGTENVVKAQADFTRLLALESAQSSYLGEPVDPSPQGPRGDL